MTNSKWKTKPATGEWSTANNWDPADVPTDTATFATSSQAAITFSPTSEVTVNSIEFSAGAPAYTFMFSAPSPGKPTLEIEGHGITNSSTNKQSFIVAATSAGYGNPQLKFTNSATAGGTDMYYCAGPETAQGPGGGVIRFCGSSTAGSALFKAWTGAGTPPRHGSTVGGEISFGDSSTAGTGRFIIYGSTSLTDGDTFGNVVFHDNSTAANGTFTNVGGTVSGGDGGNTQFYDNSTAAGGCYYNYGGTYQKKNDKEQGSNGGDVAFDGNANGGYGRFYNYAAPAPGSYGGVTSFNNNPGKGTAPGASAGHGHYFNYGARDGEQGGGGHIEFSAKYGSPTAAYGTFNNYGSSIKGNSSAGHTIFSINLPNPNDYYPTAGNGVFWNHPAAAEGGGAGFTEFSVYSDKNSTGTDTDGNVPTAGDGTFHNMGACKSGADGGCTKFSGASSAGNARLFAYGGANDCNGGKIAFYGESSGGAAHVYLSGNGELDIRDHTKGLTIGSLDLSGGIIRTQVGATPTPLTLVTELVLNSTHTYFQFYYGDYEYDTPYTILTAPKLYKFKADHFKNYNPPEGVKTTFTIDGDDLKVTFHKE